MSSVKTFLRRQQDVNHFPSSSSSRANQNQNSPEVERPLSEYDNLATSAVQTHFPLADIKFRFDDLPSAMSSSSQNSSTVNYNNNNNSRQVHSYENVVDTVKMRNKRENNDQQQVKMDQTDGNALNWNRPVMSEAKSSFFGLSNSQKDNNNDNNNDLEILIEDCANITIVTQNDVQYVNLCEDLNRITNSNADKVSATSSASGSSSLTATPPSISPAREHRKNSEGSSRSKSPKFILPETSSASPSQVIFSLSFCLLAQCTLSYVISVQRVLII
jgi:hypothetical protein